MRKALIVLLLAVAAGLFWWLVVPREPPGPQVHIEEIKVGTGAKLKPGAQVTVHYVARIYAGPVYSETRSNDQPFTFIVGAGHVLPGWERGIAGMREGGIRKLTIPPELGYGETGSGKIPPNSVLEVEVELLKVSG